MFTLQLIPSVTLFRLDNVATGYNLNAAESRIRVLDLTTSTWTPIEVREKDDPHTQQQREAYFKTVGFRGDWSSSKIT